jgi:hypothetical protein
VESALLRLLVRSLVMGLPKGGEPLSASLAGAPLLRPAVLGRPVALGAATEAGGPDDGGGGVPESI